MPKNTTVLAFCGKGGVGKTSIAAMVVRLLSELNDCRVLAIDADPAEGLSTALGIHVRKTVDDVRNEFIRQVEAGGLGADKSQMLAMLDYEMFSAVAERDNLAFLAIGRPETEGCYCQVNHILKDVIASVAENFDYVVIDGEAGIEQVNRRVMETVTHLVLVSDASVKGLQVAGRIKTVADRTIGYRHAALLINRIQSETEWAQLSVPADLPGPIRIPEDQQIRRADIAGESLLDQTASPALTAVGKCLYIMSVLSFTPTTKAV
ncbi:MAG: AAA family ATPase [Thermodesulfobacteriota bacterium]